jgi:hypothetical protein
MSSLQRKHREFANPAVLAKLLQPLPKSALQAVADQFAWDKWSRKITFEPYFRLQLMLALTHYHSLREMQWASRNDPLFARHGARLEVSVPALSLVPERRGAAPFLAVLPAVLAAVQGLPHRRRQARGLTTATLKSIQELLVRTHIADSSTCALPPTVAQWAQTEPAGDAAGYKLHLRLCGGYGGVAQFSFSPSREHDSPHLDPLVTDLEPGDLLLVDRGYLDYTRFDQWSARGIFFVSKLRKNHSDEVLEEQDLGNRQLENGYVLVREQRVRLGSVPREGEAEYRLLEVISPEGKRETLVTNLWEAQPEQIVALAQYRWTIEIVFRWLKHTLGLKHLISTKKEGVEIQIAMALLVYALLVLYQQGDQDWSPKYLLLELNVQLQQAYAAYVYELGRAGLPPPPELQACLPAYA